jgi:suppressor of ftsI
MSRRKQGPWRALACIAVVVVAAAGCTSEKSDKAATTTTESTTTTADPSGLGQSSTTPQAGEIVETSFPTKQGLPYAEPAILRSQGGVLKTSFDVKTSTFDIGGQQIKGMSYTEGIIGPTLLVNPGDTIEIALKNDLDQPTNFHTHGLHTSPIKISDNVFRVMEPASDSPISISVPANIAPGTYWYHAHLHGLTEPQVFSGLAGALVVTGLTERLPAALQQGLPEHLIGLRDLQIDGDTIITKDIDSNAPTTRTVNGLVNPVLTGQPGQAQLLRLANMSADIWYRLKMDGAQFNVIAEDANPSGTVTTPDELLLPPGKRFDVLVRWAQPGTFHLRTLKYQTGPDGDTYPERVLATWNVAGTPEASPPAMPTTMGPVPALQNDTIAQTRNVVFSEDANAGKFFINGKQFTTGKPIFYPKLGTTEEWVIQNTASEEHPFHIHVNDFQVMSINGKAVSATSLEDTVRLPAKGTVVVRMRFEDFLGKYVFHCHILNHEDNGMMAAIEVTSDGNPPPPGTNEANGQGPVAAMKDMPGM